MKRTLPVLTAAVLLMAAMVMAQTNQVTPAPATTPASKPMPMPTAVTGTDNGNMQATMNQIVADKTLRVQMLEMLIAATHTDPTFRHEMVRAIVQDKELHAAMQEMHAKNASAPVQARKAPANEKPATASPKSETK